MQRQEGRMEDLLPRMEDLLREPRKIDLSQYPFFRESLKFGHSFFKGLRPSGRGANEIIMKVGLSLVESSKMEELDERWKMQWMEEAELFLERNDLMREQTKLILDAINNNNNNIAAFDQNNGEHEQEQELDLSSKYPYLKQGLQLGFNNSLDSSRPAVCETMVKRGLALMESSKIEQLNNKWKKICVSVLFSQRLKLLVEQTRLLTNLVDNLVGSSSLTD